MQGMTNRPMGFQDEIKRKREGIYIKPVRFFPILCLTAGDYVALLAAEWAALTMRSLLSSYSFFSTEPVYFYFWIPASFLVFLLYGGLYGRTKPLWQMAEKLFHACLYGVVLTVIVLFVSHEAGSMSRLFIGFLTLFSFPFLFAVRYGMRMVLGKLHWIRTPVLIIGAGFSADALVREIRGSGVYEIVGFLEDHEPKTELTREYPVLGGFSDLETVVREKGVRTAFIAAPGLAQDRLVELVYRAQSILSDVGIVPNLVDVPMSHMTVETFFDDRIMVLHIKNNLSKWLHRYEKRIFDFTSAIAGILCTAPICIVMLLWIRWDSPGPVFFKQQRIGRKGRTFFCYKFRSMCVDADEKLKKLLQEDPAARIEWNGSFKLKEDPRITRAGRFLRRTSLDELPQLWNVLKGDMSLVGPRPIVKQEAKKYGSFIREYHQVRPGITGLWQVSGRSDVDYAERVRMDSWYVHNWSIWIDLMLLWRTVHAVWKRSGAY